MKQLRVLDLFAGAGGISLGFHWAGFQTAVAIDHSAFSVETLQGNFGEQGTTSLLRDLASFGPSDLAYYLKRLGQAVTFDVIAGGPPCQGWSSVGRGKMRSLRTPGGRRQEDTDPRNELYKRFLDYIKYFQPAVALMENVPGMLSHNRRNVADRVAQSLRDIDYEVTWRLVTASDYGVPQERQRLIFVGIRKDLDLKFEFPETHSTRGRRLFPEVTVREAIADLPIIRNGSQEWVRAYQAKWNEISAYARLMRKGADPKTIFDHVCRNQNEQDLEAFRFLPEGGRYIDLPKKLKRYRDDIFKDKYKKLRWNSPSWTVTAHLSKDCYTHIHPSQTRTISIREAARLQSFPDCFYFAGPMGSKFQLIGNAVPPLLASTIATAIREQVFDVAPSRQLRLSPRASKSLRLSVS